MLAKRQSSRHESPWKARPVMSTGCAELACTRTHILRLICETACGAGAAFGSSGKPEDHEERAIEPDQIGIGQTA